MNVEQLSKFLVEKLVTASNGLTEETIRTALNEYHRHHLVFVSDAAKKSFIDAGQPDGIIPTGKDGKVTVADVKKAAGIVPKDKKQPTPWDSAAAKELAEQYKLTGENFPQNERTGRVLKEGFVKVSVADVRKYVEEVLGIVPDSSFSSPSVAKYAEEEGVKITDFAKGTRITRAVVDAKIKELVASGKLVYDDEE